MGLGLTQYIPLVAYITCVAVILITLFYRVEVGLYLVTFLIPLQNLMDKLIKFPFGKDIMDVLVLAICIGIFFHKKQVKDIHYGKKNLNIFIFLSIPFTYSALWVGSLKFGLSAPVTFDNPQLIMWKNYIILPILYFITISIIKEKKQIFWIILIMVAAVFLMNVHFYSSARWHDYSSYSTDLRQSGTFNYLGPNELAAFFAQFNSFLIAFFLMDKLKIRKLIFLSLIFFNFYCILYLFSRGAYLATFISLIFLGIFKNWKILILILALLISWHSILPNAVIERIEMTSEEGALDGSSKSRLEMWSEAFGVIKTNPLTGIGFGSTHLLGIKKTSSSSHVRRDIHNGYIEVILEQGFLGFFILFSIFRIAFKESWLLYRESKESVMKGLGLGVVTMLITILVANLFGDILSYLNVMGYFWILLGLVMRARQITHLEKENAASLEYGEYNKIYT